jgi:sugar fermentation stimulation protein A
LEFFKEIKKATFLARPNRFTLLCDLDGKAVNVFLPNPGRLWELLLPGVTLYLESASNKERTLPYTAVAVEREGMPVMLHTHKTNAVARFLLEHEKVPGLEGARVIKSEIMKGKSRFDFLLKKNSKEIYLEVKSCTLFGTRVAMFPDAVTKRGRRHIEELSLISNEKINGAVLFLINWPHAELFLPDYHTDLDFAKTLLDARKKITIIPLSISWMKDLTLASRIKVVTVPWNSVEKEAMDRGSYLIVLRLPKRVSIKVGKLGMVNFKEGYYTYIGSARKNLAKRIERHKRLRKNLFWHIDYLRAQADFCRALPVRSSDDLECEIAVAMKKIAGCEVSNFGASDCACSSHLFWTEKNPMFMSRFLSLLQYFRMDRLVEIT